MNNKMYIINIMCTQTHRRWENRRNVFNSRSDKSEVLKMRFFMFICIRATWSLWGNDDDTRGGSYHIGRAYRETCRLDKGEERERERENEMKKVIQQYRIALGYFYFIILCIYHYYIIIIISIRLYLRRYTLATVAVYGGDGRVFISRPRAPVATIARWFIYGGKRASIYVCIWYIYIYIVI